MPIANRRRAAGALLILTAAALLAGCAEGGHFTILGYTTAPNYDTGIRTVYVPIPKNDSFAQRLEFYLQEAVVREITQNTPYMIQSDPSRADTALELKIVNRTKFVMLPNQINGVRSADVMPLVQVVWRDLRPGRKGDILSNKERFDPNELPLPGQPRATAPIAVPVMVTPTASYQPELGGSTATADKQAIDRAAIQIRQMMEKSW